MAQNMPQANRMPELQLRQELRSRFPEFNGATVMKVMKMYNNDTEKCFQHLERESQKSLFASPPDTNNHPQSANHNNNFNHSPGNNILHGGDNSQQHHHYQPSSSTVGNFSSVSQASLGMPRYQEVPVKHETMHHISTVQHMVGPPQPPSIPPKPLPPKSDVGLSPASSSFAHPSQAGMQQTHPRLLIDPVNQGSPYPHSAPIGPHDFAPFMESSPRKPTDIPNIRCGPTSFSGGSSTVVGGGGGSGGGSSSSVGGTGVRPVRVINVRGFTSGGTVTSGTMVSPTSAYSNPRFSVLHGNGGGTCSLPASSASGISPAPSGSARFSGQAYVEPQQWAQETERSGIHSSSIYIDPTMTPRRTNIQETDPSAGSAHAHQYTSTSYKPAVHYPESPRLSSLPPPRTSQALTVSLSSHATSQGLPERSQPSQNVTSVAGFAYSGGVGYNPAFIAGPSQPSLLHNNSGFVVGGGNRFVQEGASPSPPRSVTVAMNQLTIVPGGGSLGPSPSSTPQPQPLAASSPSSTVLIGARASPVLPPKSPSLQHQRSTGSSTSRSNSMDSEHDPSSVEPPPPLPPPHTSPLASHHGPMHPVHHHHHHRGIVGMGVGHSGLVGVSPASSQSSLSSESSCARDRDVSNQRQRSGSMQEEAAYSQALLHHQQLRMDKLTEDIESKRLLLRQLREEVSEAEKSKLEKKSLRTTFPTADDIASLCESNRRLQTDIQMYLNEIDMYKNGQTPFSVIDPFGQQNFFNNMPTGPNDLFVRQQNQHNNQQQQQQQHQNQQQRHRHRSPPPPPPPRPPPMRPPPPQPPMRVNSDDLTQTVPAPAPGHTEGGGSADSEEGERWACNACTFENHPALKKCEMCEMPRMMAGS